MHTGVRTCSYVRRLCCLCAVCVVHGSGASVCIVAELVGSFLCMVVELAVCRRSESKAFHMVHDCTTRTIVLAAYSCRQPVVLHYWFILSPLNMRSEDGYLFKMPGGWGSFDCFC